MRLFTRNDGRRPLLFAAGALALAVPVLIHCGGAKRDKRSDHDSPSTMPTGVAASVKSDSGGVVVASMDPNATETQLVSASADSNVAGVQVAFPPGSLTIATEVTVQEGEAIAGDLLVGETGLPAGTTVDQAGAPVMIASSEAVDLLQPMVIALPVPAGTALTGIGTLRERMGVVYRVNVQGTGERRVGVVPSTALTLSDGKLLYQTRYFGWFQVTVFDRPVEAVEREASLPLHLSITMITANMSLPSCGKADLGRTVYVVEESTFKYCSESGWTNIDLRGPAGADGTDGAAGATGATGAQGPQGANGNNGTNGTPGQNGTSYRLFTAADVPVGFVISLDSNKAMVGVGSGAGFGVVNINSDGTWASAGTNYCYYATADCTGTCYTMSRPPRNTIYLTEVSPTTTWRVVTGGESTTTISPNSYYYSGGCQSTSISATSVYGLTTSYTWPAGVPVPPIAAPYYVDE